MDEMASGVRMVPSLKDCFDGSFRGAEKDKHQQKHLTRRPGGTLRAPQPEGVPPDFLYLGQI